MHYNFGKTFIVELFNTILPLHNDDTTTIAEKLARLTIFINRMRDTAAQTPAISEVWDRAISAPLNEAYRVQDANVIRDLPSNEPTKIIDERSTQITSKLWDDVTGYNLITFLPWRVGDNLALQRHVYENRVFAHA